MNLIYSIFGVSVAFATIFLLVVKRLDLGFSLLVGSIILGFTFLTPKEVLQAILRAVSDLLTIKLVLAVVSITLLGFLYQETSKLTELSRNLGKLLPDNRFTVAIVPALFGMLPTIGGALLSAPVVDEEGRKLNARGEWKTFVNVWFRHVIFLIYPLSTFIIFASYLSGVDVVEIILYELPVFAIAVAAGYLTAFKGIITQRSRGKLQREALKKTLMLLSPILIAVALNAALKLEIFIAVSIGILTLVAFSKSRLNTVLEAARKARLQAMVSAALGVMVFREMVTSSNLPYFISNFIQGRFLPPILPATAIPLVLGFITGSPTGAIGISIPMLSTINTLTTPSVSLIFTCCLIGYIVSPLHLCFTLTSEYFKTKIVDVYPRLIVAAMITVAAQLFIYLVFI